VTFAGRESGICLTNTSHYNLLIVMVFLAIDAIQELVRFQDLRRLWSGDRHRCRIALAVSRPLVPDYGTTFHLDYGGRDLPLTLLKSL